MRLVRDVGLAAIAGAVLLVASGCSDADTRTASSSSTAPTATASTSTTTPTMRMDTAWHPCSIPDGDITVAGLDPATKRTDSGAASSTTKFPGWDTCTWRSRSWYGVIVFSTNQHTFEQVVGNVGPFENPKPLDVVGRRAMQVNRRGEPDVCAVVLATSYGAVSIEVHAKLTAQQQGNSCAEAVRITSALAKDLPRAG